MQLKIILALIVIIVVVVALSYRARKRWNRQIFNITPAGAMEFLIPRDLVNVQTEDLSDKSMEDLYDFTYHNLVSTIGHAYQILNNRNLYTRYYSDLSRATNRIENYWRQVGKYHKQYPARRSQLKKIQWDMNFLPRTNPDPNHVWRRLKNLNYF